jgi:ketosteroid isomerase-like protein
MSAPRRRGRERTGKILDIAFAIILTIAGGEITHFSLLEDSFATPKAARDTV